MKVFLPIATSQFLKVRGRADVVNVNVSIRNEYLDTTATTASIAQYIDGYLKIPFSHPFVEGETFEITVNKVSDGALVWRGKAFSTAQTPNVYKLST